jgi:glycosyltransferase involved in cell wall biosynthesis
MKKICIVATIPFALNVFMKPHIAMLAKQYKITLITNGVELDVKAMLNENVRFVNIKLIRKISLWRDFIVLIQLCIMFRKERFDVVHSLTPKAGLLCMVAACVAGVPNRIHTFTGQVWVVKKSISRLLLKVLDKLIAICATHLLTDSFTQRQFLINEHIVKENKIQILANGSVCGVNVQRFKPDIAKYQQMRNVLGIPKNAIVYLYLGRLNKEKGIQDLAFAFKSIANKHPFAHLLVVGPDEGGMDLMLRLILDECSSQFHRVGYTSKPENYMACSDVLCLPSYREGFGSVIIEAAAAGIPSVASNIYGLIDAVEDGETGILHQPKNIEEISQALLKFMNEKELHEKMAKQAINRAHNLFAEDMVVDAMRIFYQKVLN